MATNDVSNVNAPKGLIPIKHWNGSAWNGMTNMFLKDSGDGTALFVGDLVKGTGTSGATGQVVNGVNCEGLPIITQSAAGNTHIGVVVGFLPVATALQTKHSPASTAQIALVVDAPDTIFEIQEDSVGGDTAVTDVGANVEVIVGSGSTTTGVSAALLDSSTAATTNTLSLRIHRLVNRPGNAVGTYAKWEVSINLHAYTTTTGI